MHFIFVAYKKTKNKSTVSSLRPPPLTLISVLVVILLQSRSGCGSRFNDHSHYWAFRVTEIQTQLETVAAQIPEMMTVNQLCLCVNMELEHVQCL